MLNIKIYEDKTSKIDYKEIKKFIEKKISGAKVELRKNFFEHFNLISEKSFLEKIKRDFFRARVFDIFKKNLRYEPFKIDLDFEEKVIRGQEISTFLYDAHALWASIYELIPEEEKRKDVLHIIFINRIIASFEESDRYHARVIILSNPSLISAHAITHALALPKEYYIAKQSLRVDDIILKERFKDRIIDKKNEEIMTKACICYAMQALFYNLYGECHCNDKKCMLYNAHFQEELLAMLKELKLCERHENMLKSDRNLRG